MGRWDDYFTDRFFLLQMEVLFVMKVLCPVLKWIGGKTQLLDPISNRMPKWIKHYFEPFVGGGAVLFRFQPKQAVVSDINPQLINFYKQLQMNLEDVIAALELLNDHPADKDMYLALRDRFNAKIASYELDVECAALMLWLNKHCFNGLYRTNRKGMFNAAYNNEAVKMDIDGVIAVAKYLQSADIVLRCCDFEDTLADVGDGDFVYLDSPYVPEGGTANFVRYAKGGFDLEDHKRLAKVFKDLDAKGAFVMLSNNDVPLVHELYAGYNVEALTAKRLVNRDASKRTGHEVLITNY